MSSALKILRFRRDRRSQARHLHQRRNLFGGMGCGMLLSLLLAALFLSSALAYAGLTRDLPSVEILPHLLNPPDGQLLQPTRLYDRSGEHLLQTFAMSESPRRYLPLNPQNPQHLTESLARATVAMLDPGFWTHAGYSMQAWQDPELHLTIAQQLVSDLLLYKEQPSIPRALRERILAAQITAEYGRSQILEWYLNSANYGHFAYGADAAAQLYFGKPASELTLAESAILAAVGQAPSLNPFDARDAAVQRGREAILVMQALGLITEQEASGALAESLKFQAAPAPPSASLVPAFLNLVLDQLDGQFTRERVERGGLTVFTTLDYELQQQAACITQVYAARLEGGSGASANCTGAELLPALPPGVTVVEPSASALILDPQNGQILAMVGETLRGEQTALLSGHDPGSLMTPFVYLTGFTRGLSPASLVWDIPSAGDVQNPDGQFHGPVRIRVALANDYLVPAATIASQMGADAIARTESSFGLGRTDAGLLDMAAAYASFAAQGLRYGQPGPAAVLRVEAQDHAVWLDWADPQAQAVVTPGLAYLVTNALSDESARWPSFGHPNPFEIGRPAGAKFGQTGIGLDVWAVGYTPQRLVAVWTGTHAADSLRLSPRLPAVLWNALMQISTQGLPAYGWSPPAGVTTMDVCDPSGLLPSKDCPTIVSEVFLNGNEPAQVDDLYRTYTVNRETGFLATVFTAPQLAEERVYMVVPPEAQAWARSAGFPVPPDSYDAIQVPPRDPDVHITAPAMFAEVSGQVQIIGTAAGADFAYYRVLVGKGLNAQEWVQLGGDSASPVTEGTLAVWDATGLSGLYALQLQVIRSDQRVDTAVIQVTIGTNP